MHLRASWGDVVVLNVGTRRRRDVGRADLEVWLSLHAGPSLRAPSPRRSCHAVRANEGFSLLGGTVGRVFFVASVLQSGPAEVRDGASAESKDRWPPSGG